MEAAATRDKKMEKWRVSKMVHRVEEKRAGGSKS